MAGERPCAVRGLSTTAALGAVALRIVAPDVRLFGHLLVSWLSAFVLAMLLAGILSLAVDVRAGRARWTRILLPAILFGEGASLLGSDTLSGGVALAGTTVLLLEVFLVVLAVRELRRASSEERATRPEERIAGVLGAFVPAWTAQLMAFELVIVVSSLHFLLVSRRHPPPRGFGYHASSTFRVFLLATPILLSVEALAVELIIPERLFWLRILHLCTVVYAALWIMGTYALMRGRPHVVTEDMLRFHRGLMRSLAIPPSLITAVAPLPDFASVRAEREALRGAHRLDMAGVSRLELRLERPVPMANVIGSVHASAVVVISADEPEALRSAIACVAEAARRRLRPDPAG